MEVCNGICDSIKTEQNISPIHHILYT
jgi:hypothetical protein